MIGPDHVVNGSDVVVGSGGSSLGLVEELEAVVPNPAACQSPINARVMSETVENVVMRDYKWPKNVNKYEYMEKK
jgi:hypothetical protein